jgi:hypothetical protein
VALVEVQVKLALPPLTIVQLSATLHFMSTTGATGAAWLALQFTLFEPPFSPLQTQVTLLPAEGKAVLLEFPAEH